MSSPGFRRTIDSTAHPKAEEPAVHAGTSGGCRVGDVLEQFQTREDLEKALVESRKSEAQLRKIIDADIDDLKRAESLLSAEKRTLEMIAGGSRLTDILENLCRAIDAQTGDAISTVLLMDPDGKRLWPAAGPRVPSGWTQAITPLPIGPGVGSCGTAAFLKQPVIVADIATDPLWALAAYREVALRPGLRAGWSQSILAKHQ